MNEAKTQTNKAIFLALLGYLSYSINDAFRKLIAGDYGSVEIFFWVSVISLIFLFVMSGKLGGVASLFKTKKLKFHLIRGATGACATFFSLKTFIALPMVEAYTIFFISPFIVTILSVFIWGEKISVVRILALVGGFAGILVAMRPDINLINEGMIYGFIAALSYSAFLLTTKPLRGTETHFSMLFYPVIFAVILSYILTGDINIVNNINDWGILFMGAIPSLAGTLFLIRAFSIADASIVSITHYSQLIWGFIIGLFFFAEYPDIYVFLGSFMVVFSAIILVLEKRLQKLILSRKGNISAKAVAAE